MLSLFIWRPSAEAFKCPFPSLISKLLCHVRALECDLISQGCRLKKNFGRTGAPSHSRKKTKVSATQKVSLLFDNRHVRLISWSKPIRDSKGWTPPSDCPWSRYSCMCVCVWRCVCCCSQRERWVVEMHAALSLNLICSVSVWQSLQDSAIAEFIAKSCKLRHFPNCCRFCS